MHTEDEGAATDAAGGLQTLPSAEIALVSALMQTPIRRRAPRRRPLQNALRLPRSLVEAVRRNGLRQVVRFAKSMLAEEGVRGALRIARLSPTERRLRVAERRRLHHTAAAIKVRPQPLKLRRSPPQAHPFETAIFAPWPAASNSPVPLIGYQHYAMARLRYTGELETDSGRRAALIWYIETYSTFRRPFKVPFSGEQIAWLLEPEVGGSEHDPPRIVDWFLAREEMARGEQISTPAAAAFWWCIRKAPELNIEHALLPPAYVALLRAPIGASDDPAPLSELLLQHCEDASLPEAEIATTAGRFGAYADLLMRDDGLHESLFFPEGILARLARVGSALPSTGGGRFDRPALLTRAAAALEHRRRMAEIWTTPADLSAARLNQDWMQAMAAGAGDTVAADDPRPPAPVFPTAKRSVLPFPVRLIGPLNSQSGLGQASRLSLAALNAVGVEVETLDFLLDNPAPRRDAISNSYSAGAEFGINLLHLSGESLPLAAAFLDPDLFLNKTNIGYFFWELPHPAVCHELSLCQLDEIWVSSQFNQEIYTPVFSGPVTRVGMALQPPLAQAPDRGAVRGLYGLPEDAFIFVTTFDALSFMGRKNPAGSLRAFKQAFPSGFENVRLVVKTHNLMRTLGEARGDALRGEVLELCQSDPRILLIDETMKHADLLALKSACDAYVSLHRSEGWGFGMLESMQLGLPVIATNFSGNIDFCDEETGWPVGYKLVSLAEHEYIFSRPEDYWADPDLGSAARAMRAAEREPALAAKKGAAAKARVLLRYSPSAVGAVYLDRLRSLGAAGKLAGRAQR